MTNEPSVRFNGGRPQFATLTEKQISLISKRVIPPSTAHMSDGEREAGTHQMIRDLESLAYADGCIAAAWALEFIWSVTSCVRPDRQSISELGKAIHDVAGMMGVSQACCEPKDKDKE